MTDALTEALLSKPTAPKRSNRTPDEDLFTKRIERHGDALEVELRGEVGSTDESAAAAFLRAKGEDPDHWEATGFRSSEWTMANGSLGESTRYVFRAKAQVMRAELPIDDLVDRLLAVEVAPPTAADQHGFIVALGDFQLGKIDGDGVDGTVRRTLTALKRAADLARTTAPAHVHVAYLGDHVEGFTSQGGANVWRTPLTLNEQIRIVRRIMTEALVMFAPLAPRVTFAAVPGNHGEPQRFAGKGVTRYDDSHDTESLIAVSEAAQLAGDRFDHCEFYVPETDEMTVVLDVSGTTVGHVHGHQFRPNRHIEWWKGQAFGRGSQMEHVDLLLAGHLHHLHVEMDGPRMFLQVPAMESESTWWRHATGTVGYPGLVTLSVHDGQVGPIRLVKGDD